MANQVQTIRKFVGFLNNVDEQGGYWLPNIQRAFVWKEGQIERLYDSILREYPIGTLLVWKTKSRIKRRKFIDHYHSDIRLVDFYVHEENENSKMMVLDGQQRLQSLFIGLKGSYDRKELFIDILSGDLRSPDDMKYEFKFLDARSVVFPWIKFKDVVLTDRRPREIHQRISESTEGLTDAQNDRIEDNIGLIREVFCTQENILFQLVDSIDRPNAFSEDDVVEIFIRANSGGTPLGKSDLLFSLLTASWDEAEDNMSELLEDLNRTGYKFTRDFVLKTCLVLLNKGARYNVEKFRDTDVRTTIMNGWDKITDAIKGVKDFVYGSTFLKTDKTIPSYLSLVPLIYLRYHHENQWDENDTDLKQYLIRTSLTGSFGGNPDQLLDKLVARINEDGAFDLSEILGVVREVGRSLELSETTLLAMKYTSKEIHLLFNLWYGFNYQPALRGNLPQVDHIFPQSELRKVKITNPETGRMDVMKYRQPDRDQIGNLMLLTAAENGAGGKNDLLPEAWLADKPEEYLDLHLIPRNRDLWKLESFDEFVIERKEMIAKKFSYLIFRS